MSRGEPYRPKAQHPQPSNAARDARIAESRETAKKVIAARIRGGSWQAVGDEVGISKSQAFKLWKDATESDPVEGLDLLRKLETAKLDTRERRANRIIARHEKELMAEATSLDRRERCAKVIATQQQELHRIADTRAKTNGTYAPTRHIVGGEDGPIELEMVTAEDVITKLNKIAKDIGGPTAPAPAEPVDEPLDEGDGEAEAETKEPS
jgi:hypothetical protein